MGEKCKYNSLTSLQEQQDMYFYFKKGIEKQSLIIQHRAKTLHVNWTQTGKDKEYTVVLK